MSPVFCLYYDCFSPQGDCVQVYEGYTLDNYRSRPLLSLEMGSSNEMNSTRIRTVLAVFFPSNERWTQFRNRPMTKEGIIPVGILRTRRSFHRGSKRFSFGHHDIELLKNFENTTSTHTESADFVLLTNRQEYPFHKIVSLILFYTPHEWRATHLL